MSGELEAIKLAAIKEKETLGAEAKLLYDDAQALLKLVTYNGSLEARGMVSFFPANSRGDDILLFADEASTDPIWVLHGLRQQEEQGMGEHWCLSDLVAPLDTGKRDYVGMFVVSAGFGCETLCSR